METPNYEQALREATKLTEMSEDTLYEKLGVRMQDIHNLGGYKRSQQYSGHFQQVAPEMLGLKDVKEFGMRWWNKLEPELINVVCSQESEDRKKLLGGKTAPQIAAALATAAMVSALAPPAWVIVATSILAIKITETGVDTLCEMWKESLKKK
jgi:hypothetical protein